MMAFFIIMKKTYFILLIISLVIPIYNYDQDDWVVIYEPDNIISITEDSFNIYFLADNGIFSYDYMDEYFYYNTKLSYDLPIGNYYYIYYHPTTDYFFIITDNEILYRSSVSFHWNSIKLTSLKLSSFNSIDKIGFSNDFLIINANSNYMKFDLYTMQFIDSDMSNVGLIDWLLESYNDINLSQFYSIDNSIISSNSIIDNSKKNHIVNCYYYDKNEDLWVGMNTGSIYKVNYFSYNIERVNIGPRLKKISGLYNNGKDKWYFFDKYFRRTGNYINNDSEYLLSIWDEPNNSWMHIPKNDDILIKNTIINDIIEINDFLFLLTLDGFLIFDIKLEKWYHDYDFLNSYDRSLWTIKNNKSDLYIGTASGVIIANFSLLDGKPNIFFNNQILNNSEIYDIEINDNKIYICSSNGLYNYNINNEELELIDKNIYYNIELNDDDIFVSNRNLWKINNSNRKLISSNIYSFNFSDDDIICASNSNEIKIIDIKDNSEWYIDFNYLKNEIYSLDCDENWLWFTNSDGLLFFKWSNYE